MKTASYTTERIIDLLELNDREAYALWAMVNRSDPNIRKVAERQEAFLADQFDDIEESIEYMIAVRNEIRDVVLDE